MNPFAKRSTLKACREENGRLREALNAIVALDDCEDPDAAAGYSAGPDYWAGVFHCAELARTGLKS